MKLLDHGAKVVTTDGGVRLETAQPWERQDGESNPAFAAFTLYLALGPERCLRVVAEQCAKSETLIRRWSARLNWRERAALFDRYEARAVHEKIVAKLATLRERDLKLADSLDEKTKLRLDTMRADEVDALSPLELATLIRVSSELKYKAREVSNEEAVCFPANLPGPTFTIQIITPGRDANGDPMIGVQFEEDGVTRYGYVPRDRIADFRRDFPDARILA